MHIEILDAWIDPPRRDGLEPMIHVMMLRDGILAGHVFPLDTLEWRAAEYEIDPNDFDTLLHIVLAEPIVGSDETHPEFLYNAPTDVARASQIKRCREKVTITETTQKRVMEDGQIVAIDRAAEGKPRDKIRAFIQMDSEVIQAKRESVAAIRRRVDSERDTRAAADPRAISPAERAARIRSNLGGGSAHKERGAGQ